MSSQASWKFNNLLIQKGPTAEDRWLPDDWKTWDKGNGIEDRKEGIYRRPSKKENVLHLLTNIACSVCLKLLKYDTNLQINRILLSVNSKYHRTFAGN